MDWLAELAKGLDAVAVGLTVAIVQALRWLIPGPDVGFSIGGRTFAVHPSVHKALPFFPLVVGIAVSWVLDPHSGQSAILMLREGIANGIMAAYGYNVLKTCVWGA